MERIYETVVVSEKKRKLAMGMAEIFQKYKMETFIRLIIAMSNEGLEGRSDNEMGLKFVNSVYVI